MMLRPHSCDRPAAGPLVVHPRARATTGPRRPARGLHPHRPFVVDDQVLISRRRPARTEHPRISRWGVVHSREHRIRGAAREGQIGLRFDEVPCGGVHRVIRAPGRLRIPLDRGAVASNGLRVSATPTAPREAARAASDTSLTAPEPPAASNAAATVPIQTTSLVLFVSNEASAVVIPEALMLPGACAREVGDGAFQGALPGRHRIVRAGHVRRVGSQVIGPRRTRGTSSTRSRLGPRGDCRGLRVHRRLRRRTGRGPVTMTCQPLHHRTGPARHRRQACPSTQP